jgi:uncharacterized protein (TIGR00369 family)
VAAEAAGEPRTLFVVAGGPERSFRVARARMQGDAVVSSMPAGPWLEGPDGRAVTGALGVMIDNVLGSALMMDGVPGRWPVSAQISLDMCRPLPADVSVLRADARIAHSDPEVGMATGSVRDDQDRLIALCQQHSRWIADPAAGRHAGRPGAGDATPAHPPVPADLPKALMAGISQASGAVSLELAVTQELANPLGNLHGGVTFCAVDVVAQAALGLRGGPCDTSSVHVTYTRPCPVGTSVMFRGAVAHCGRSLGVVQVEVVNQDGKHCALATVVTGAPAQPGQSRLEVREPDQIQERR